MVIVGVDSEPEFQSEEGVQASGESVKSLSVGQGTSKTLGFAEALDNCRSPEMAIELAAELANAVLNLHSRDSYVAPPDPIENESEWVQHITMVEPVYRFALENPDLIKSIKAVRYLYEASLALGHDEIAFTDFYPERIFKDWMEQETKRSDGAARYAEEFIESYQYYEQQKATK